MIFERVCIVGVGLIGGSFGLALRERGLAGQVVGAVRREATIEAACRLGAVDEATTDLKAAARDADLVLLASPVGQMQSLCAELAPEIRADAIVTDAGSTKAAIVRDCTPLCEARTIFLGGHPMAGSEQTGVEHARGDLFEGAIWVLTPTASTPPDAVAKMETLVVALGATPLTLEAGAHDRLLAVTSHLPHVTASALVHLFITAHDENEVASRLVAGGWRDATRVAAGSPEMWRDICLANAPALANSLDALLVELSELRTMIVQQDGERLHDWFEQAAATRRSIKPPRQDS